MVAASTRVSSVTLRQLAVVGVVEALLAGTVGRAEVLPGGGLDAVGAVAEVDPVEVAPEDELLA